MEPPIDSALKIVKGHKDPQAALAELIALCRASLPEENWSSLPQVDILGDIDDAADWLSAQLGTADNPTGIYLGLDTLNMDGGDGCNIEFGSSHTSDPHDESQEWLDDLDYGDDHLIYGLYLLHSEYASGRWSEEGYDLCDYILFLGYSGIVLLQALGKVTSSSSCLGVCRTEIT